MLPPRLVGARRPLVIVWAAVLALAAAAVLASCAIVRVRLGLFVATLAVELAALATALAGRRALQPGEPTRFAATAIAGGLALRTIAEARLLLIYVDAVPQWLRDDAVLWPLYFYGLRYFYAAADVALLAGCVHTLRGLRSTGLDFKLRPAGALALVLLAALPLLVYALQSGLDTATVDPNILAFRLLGASVGALVAAVCVALASAALQMGGGAWPWIWGAAAGAGIARVLAFVAAAGGPALPTAIVIEQALLWTFACAWLLATTLQRRLLTRR